ncbi:MAG: energy transducer TonB [Acidobacteria bacterium]|nr:energy transducer TonB [Acidobacteriota bacterium]
MPMREEKMSEDLELRAALARWVAPHAPATLDARLVDSFRAGNRDSLPEPTLSANQEVKTMKQCRTCLEEYADKFVFCPLDGTTLSEERSADEPLVSFTEQSEPASPLPSTAYHLTIIEDAGLVRRLYTELASAARASQLTWPEFKRDPLGFTRRSATAYGAMAWRFFSSPNVAIASLAAMLFMMTAVAGLVWLDHRRAQEARAAAEKQNQDLEYLGLVDIPDEQNTKAGAPGLNKGTGGGSKPRQERPGGGGGGGRNDENPVSKGKLPVADPDVPQVRGPDVKLPPVPNPSLPTPASLDLDKLLAKNDDRPLPYGMPNSTSTTPSNGTGSGGGLGNGTGLGAGSGEGGGYGPGRGGNTGGGDRNMGGGGAGGPDGGTDFNKVFKPNEVEQKARILSKPSPEYTEEARRNQTTGTVVLQMVFSANGTVTGIRTVSGLPFGLTEKAIAAARRIQFSPAMKAGRPVSQYIRVEYNFNIY